MNHPHFDSNLILYRDTSVLVVNKPAGIAAHKSRGSVPHLGEYVAYFLSEEGNIPQLAHRLDKDTSGCLIWGYDTKTLRRLGGMFKYGYIRKTYLAVVEGHPPEKEGCIDLPLGRQSEKTYHWWMKVDHAHGKEAKTLYRVMEEGKGYSVLALTPLTGRTHQLRVHCASMGCSLLGDPVYGSDFAKTASPRLQLHAHTVEIPFYKHPSLLRVEAPIPPHMAVWMTSCPHHEVT